MGDNSLLVAVSSLEQYSDESEDNQEDNQEETVVYCSLCNVNFFDSNEYEQHNIEIHGQKKYACHYCTSSFRRHDHLKRHINSIHSRKEKSIKCPICDEVFVRREGLLKHVKKKHSNARSFPCSECSYQCENIKDLESHENSHLFRETHTCTFCKKPFKRRDHMLRHIKTLHLNQYTVCPICCQQFKRKDHVVRHCREKHRMEFQNGKIVQIQDKN